MPALGDCLMLTLLLNKEAGLFLVSPETLPVISGVALPGGTYWNLQVVRPRTCPGTTHVRWKEPPNLEAKKERRKGTESLSNHVKDLTWRLSISTPIEISLLQSHFPPRSSSLAASLTDIRPPQ